MPINKKTSFSVEGFRLMRSNPDGTPPTPDRVLGFANTVDISEFAPTYIAEIIIKLDGGDEDTQDIDLSGAVDKEAVTVQEVVDAINGAGFTDITASVDTYTGRVLIQYDGSEDIGYMQVYDGSTDDFAAALDIGQGLAFAGVGVKFFKAFDNTMSIGLPKNIKDREEIEAEAGDGTILTIIKEAILKGVNPQITLLDNDFEIKQLIQGGSYVSSTNTYTPPTTDQTNKPIFYTEVFSPVYDKGTNKREDLSGYEKLTLPSNTGIEGDLTKETNAIANYIYNISSTEYRDELEANTAAYIEQNLSIEDFDALDVENV